MWDYPVCITSLCQKRKIFLFLPPHLGRRHEQQHYHKALQQAHAVPLQQTQAVYSQILYGQVTAQLSHQGGQDGDELCQAAEVSKTLPCSGQHHSLRGQGGCTARLYALRKKRPISVQQQIIGILCKFILPIEDY